MSEKLNIIPLFGNLFFTPAIKWSEKYQVFHTGHTGEDPLSNRFTGVIDNTDGSKYWCKNGNLHREEGAAIEWADGYKHWYLEGKKYKQIDLKDYVVLDSYQGNHNLTWHRLLGKDEVLEYPDIPGLIEKE